MLIVALSIKPYVSRSPLHYLLLYLDSLVELSLGLLSGKLLNQGQNGWEEKLRSALVSTVEVTATVPSTLAVQAFAIGGGIAGGLAGLYLARELADIHDVPTPALAVATVVSMIALFGSALFLAKASRRY